MKPQVLNFGPSGVFARTSRVQRSDPILPYYFPAGGAGAVVVVAHQAKIFHSEVCGLADIAFGKPLTTKTVFDLASASKTFTAAAIGLLYQRGLLKLDAPIASFFPEFDVQTGHRRPLVQDLIWHTSGLVDYLHLSPPSQYASLTPEHIRQQVAGYLPDFAPGVNDDYSNTNYFLLAEIVRIVSGTSYAGFLSAEMFVPLALHDSFVLGSIPTPPHRVRGYANRGYGETRYEIDELDIPIVGDGGVFSTAEDLLRWQHALFSGEIVDGATLRLMTAPGHLDNGARTNYGFGLIVERLSDCRTWCGHTGGWNGTSVLVGRFLEDEITVVVLSNDAHTPVVRIAQQAVSRLR